MNQGIYTVLSNTQIANNIFKMRLLGDTSHILAPGQFINIKLEDKFLRRPISVCDFEEGVITIIFKVVGDGTEKLARMLPDEKLDILTGLGNGFDIGVCGDYPVVIGGGVGVPPMYALCKQLISKGKKVQAILGFNKKDEVFYKEEFESLGALVHITTADGSLGTKGFVTDVLKNIDYSYFYACGPEPMLKAVYDISKTEGQLSFEERMGCGFGVCMGCSCITKYKSKRICKDGPVLFKEEIIW